MATQYQSGDWTAEVYGGMVKIELKGADSRELEVGPKNKLNFFAYLNLRHAEYLFEHLASAIQDARYNLSNPPGVETKKSARERIRRWLFGK